jgi:hydrogenase expression/formation protein HypC
VRKRISLALVDGVVLGDHVIVHVGYALARLDPDEAQRTLDAFAEAGMLAEAAATPSP